MSNIRPTQLELPALISEAPAPSLAEVLAAIPGWGLPATRARDLCSALRVVGRIVGLPLASIPCCTAWMNQHLFQRPPSAFSFGTKHMQSTLSRLRAVLVHLGRHMPRASNMNGLKSYWRALLDMLPEGPKRAGLHGLGRYCTARAILPTAVTSEILADYLAFDAKTRLAAAATRQGLVSPEPGTI